MKTNPKKRKVFAAAAHKTENNLKYIGGDEVQKLPDRQCVIVVTIDAPVEKTMLKARDKFFADKKLGHIPENPKCCFKFGYWRGVRDTLDML